MKLISLELHNFRKFKHTPPIYFPDGITGIIGNNGSGKSTLLEAIGWAIYGNKAARTGREQIKRQGAASHEECWVRLRFELRGNLYEVLRIMRGNFSSDAIVKVNNVVAATTATGVTKYLEKVIGMNYDSFYISIVAKQKELNALSEKTPGERKKNMLKMLKIDAIDDAIKRVREDKRAKKILIEQIESLLKDTDLLLKEKEENEIRTGELLSALEKIEREIIEQERILKEVEKERMDEMKKAQKHNELILNKRMLESRLAEKIERKKEKEGEREKIKQALKRYKEIKKYSDEYDNVKNRKDELESIRGEFFQKMRFIETKGQIEREIIKLEEEKENILKEVKDEQNLILIEKETTKEIEEKEEALKNIESEIERHRLEKKQISREMEKTGKRLQEIEKLGPESNCPMCGRRLGKEHFKKLLRDLKEQMAAMKNEIDSIEMMLREKEKAATIIKQELESLRKKQDDVEKSLRKIEIAKNRMGYYDDLIKEKKIELEEVHKKLEEMADIAFDENEYNNISRRLKELEKVKIEFIKLQKEIERMPIVEKEIEKLQEEINEIKKEIEIVEMKINELGFDKAKFDEVERRYNEKRDEIEKLRGEKIKIDRDLIHIRREIERLGKEIEEQKEKKNKVKNMKREVANLSLLEELLNKFKNYMISKIGPSLSFYSSHFFSIFTGGKYDTIEIDDEYNIYIYDRGEKFPINRFSGGEEDLANLALRLAISELIARRADTSFEFIALDEVFGSQDNERRRNVLNALGELKKQFKQILLITHIEDIKDEMEHIIRVYEDDEGISHVKVE